MGLKFNFRASRCIGDCSSAFSLALAAAIMVYRQRVLAVKAKQQE